MWCLCGYGVGGWCGCADGDGGMRDGRCRNRAESAAMDDTRKSLVLVNYFSSIPLKQVACVHNSAELIGMLHTCYAAAGKRWANFVAVDYYKVGNATLNYLWS